MLRAVQALAARHGAAPLHGEALTHRLPAVRERTGGRGRSAAPGTPLAWAGDPG
jgi:hypothetical protein